MCSTFAEDLYKRLITYADDYGRFNADTEIMLARLYPRELFYITQEDVIDALLELCGVGKIAFYTASVFGSNNATSGVYGCFPNWKEHQRVRDSKRKCPDPEDTRVNDWYLRRFIPLDMKAQIVERDGFKCRICGKFVTTCRDAKRFVKLGSGMYHIDHIVPCNQGGRATLENLQLSCPQCNLSRKKHFTFDEIVRFAEMGEENTEFTESRGNSPQLAALIQSNPESKSESISKKDSRKSAKHTLGEYSNVFLTDEELDKLKAEFPDWEERIERLSSYIASSGKKYKNHLATIRNWARGDENKQQTAPTNHKIGPGAFAIDPVSYDARLRKDMEWLKQFSESEGANG